MEGVTWTAIIEQSEKVERIADTIMWTFKKRKACAEAWQIVWKHTVQGQSSCLGKHRSKNGNRSEEHTSELQSQSNLVCRLLLEKKKKTKRRSIIHNNTEL